MGMGSRALGRARFIRRGRQKEHYVHFIPERRVIVRSVSDDIIELSDRPQLLGAEVLHGAVHGVVKTYLVLR